MQDLHRTNRRRKQAGFTLLELLISVTIILVIAAIAIPSYLRAKRASNESAAAGTLRSMQSAASNFRSTWMSGYPPASVASAAQAAGGASADTCKTGIWDSDLLNTGRSGYKFAYTPTGSAVAATGCDAGGTTFVITASPINPGSDGIHYFCAMEDNSVRVSPSPIASESDCLAASNLSAQ